MEVLYDSPSGSRYHFDHIRIIDLGASIAFSVVCPIIIWYLI